MSRTALRSGAERIGMACYAIWIALVLTMQGARPCPTHDPHVAAQFAGATMPATMPRMAHEGASLDSPLAAAHLAHQASHGAAHHVCTCVGCGCCVAMLDPSAHARTLVPAPATITRETAAAVAPRAAAIGGADRRLPFANGPPSGVSVPA